MGQAGTQRTPGTAPQFLTQMSRILSALNLIDWREVFLIVAQGLLICAVATYVAGEYTGRKMYAASDYLAEHWPTKPTAANPVPCVIPTPVVVVSTGADDLLTMRIAALRAEGLSQRAIAERVGTSRSTVRRRLAMA